MPERLMRVIVTAARGTDPQFGESLAVQLGLGDQNAPRNHRLVMDHRLGVDLPPEQGYQRLDVPGRGDQQDAVAAMKRRRSVGQFGASAAAADARNDEIPQRNGPGSRRRSCR